MYKYRTTCLYTYKYLDHVSILSHKNNEKRKRKNCRNRSRMWEALLVRVCFCRRRGRYLYANNFPWENHKFTTANGEHVCRINIIIIIVWLVYFASTERFRHELLDAIASRVRTPIPTRNIVVAVVCSRGSAYFFLPGK